MLKPKLALVDDYFNRPHGYVELKPELALAVLSFDCPHGYAVLKPELALADSYFDHIPTSTLTYTSCQQRSSRHTSNSLPTPAMLIQPHISTIRSTPKYPHNHLATSHPSLPLPTDILKQLIWDLITKDLITNFTLFVNTTNKLSPVIIVTSPLFPSLSFGCSYSHA